jgi:proteasome lid subunit RPN8/RPN11
MQEQTVEAIRSHAQREYPRECCGLVVVVKGRERYVACANAAQGTDHFILPAAEYAAAEAMGEITAVIHSHPDVPATPSQADLVACEASGLPWHIVRVDMVDGAPLAGELVSIEPTGYKAPLVGRQFSHGVLDCYQLIVDWYQAERGITLKQFQRADNWWNDGSSDLYTQGFPQAGFRKIGESEQIEFGDVILMQISARNQVPNHASVYIGDGLMLHHLHGRLSSRDLYSGYFQEVTRAILRYQP